MNTTQIFLSNFSILKKIVNFAKINSNDVVLEIGSGDGRLTKLLAEKAKKVYGIEIDPELADMSKYKLSAFQNVEIINGNALEINWPDVNKIVSNLPYAIASPLTQKIVFYLNEKNAELAVLMFQKELADRILAFPGLRDYSMFSVLVQYACDVKELMDVSKVNFRPMPSVDSKLLMLKPKKIEINKDFLSFCKVLFLHKKKNVYSALIDARELIGISKEELQDKASKLSFAKEKVFYLSIEDLLLLYNECKDKKIWKGTSQEHSFYD